MASPAPNPRAALDAHIAQRRTQLEEEIRHFTATAQVATVPFEKAEAQARVEVATAFLNILPTI